MCVPACPPMHPQVPVHTDAETHIQTQTHSRACAHLSLVPLTILRHGHRCSGPPFLRNASACKGSGDIGRGSRPGAGSWLAVSHKRPQGGSGALGTRNSLQAPYVKVRCDSHQHCECLVPAGHLGLIPRDTPPAPESSPCSWRERGPAIGAGCPQGLGHGWEWVELMLWQTLPGRVNPYLCL